MALCPASWMSLPVLDRKEVVVCLINVVVIMCPGSRLDEFQQGVNRSCVAFIKCGKGVATLIDARTGHQRSCSVAKLLQQGRGHCRNGW